ncbi:ATP-binding cassette domain-containing protein [Lentisphaerota bacterium WC36G]|nr:ATP-binding cassette domain-containing protein [Lentisphaerae bacterium WC36]
MEYERNDINADSVISIKNASVKIGGTDILKSINWEVKKGERWFILGANGAGKTSLVKMLMGYQWPLFGAEVSVLGYKFGGSNLVEMRQKISLVSPFLAKWTHEELLVQDIVLSGIDHSMQLQRDATEEEICKAEEIMTSFNCQKLAQRKYAILSSGEQLKILICRALMSEPELVIFDEPCVYLDMRSREYLLEVLESYATRKNASTLIFITQRIEDITPTYTDGLVLVNGEIIDKGAREFILTEETLFKTYNMNLKLHKTSDGRLWPVPVK